MDRLLLRKSAWSSAFTQRLQIAKSDRLKVALQTQVVDVRLLIGGDVKEAAAIGASDEHSPLGALEPQ
jgi:hypothetical protein